MVYRSNSNKEIKLEWNPLELFRQYNAGIIPPYFSSDFRIIHIQLPLNCRLLPAVNIHCLRIADTVIISKGKHYSRKKIHTSFRQRAIESNQFDNLSPPVSFKS